MSQSDPIAEPTTYYGYFKDNEDGSWSVGIVAQKHAAEPGEVIDWLLDSSKDECKQFAAHWNIGGKPVYSAPGAQLL